MNRRILSFSIAVYFCLSILCCATHGQDWPMWRFDSQRSGYTTKQIPSKLSLKWMYKSGHAPQPAWSGRDTRMPYDLAYHTVIADGTVFFASSADCKVYALDSASGKELWTFFTDAPVRFAPAVWKDKVFVASDDGLLYCLRAQTGKVLWRLRGGPVDSMVLGNERMVSRWPARGGLVIKDGILYFGAGIWPSEDIFIYAVDGQTGKVLWVNDYAGGFVMEQPHGGNRARSGISAQGYLSVSEDTLMVPTGRAVPAAFDRSDGGFRYFHLMKYSRSAINGNGPFITLADGLTFVGGDVFNSEDGEFRLGGINVSTMAVSDESIVFAKGKQIKAVERKNLIVEKQVLDRKGNKETKYVLNEPTWTVDCGESVACSLIGAGDKVIAGTNNNKIIIVDTASKSIARTLEVDGKPYGLAAADGRLYVSTDRGIIYCFDSESVKKPTVVETKRKENPYGKNHLYAKAAEEIIRNTGITKGYCLDFGCGDGQLAYELAKRSELQIYAVESDAKKVANARKLLDEAGLYGVRVTVLHRDLHKTGLPDYFANLIVSGRSVEKGANVVADSSEAKRILRPFGGVMCIGKTSAMKKTVRGPLENTGQWTHQYANAASTFCSDDSLTKGPLVMQWFTDFGFQMPSRHGRGPAPLFKDGVLVIEGVNGLLAVDAYNGHKLWEYPIKNILEPYDQEHLVGAAATNSNMCIGDNSVYIHIENRCVRLDLKTGKKIQEYSIGDTNDVWGYIARVDGTLFGSLADKGHIVHYNYQCGGAEQPMHKLLSESIELFALDAKTGKRKWSYKAQHSIRHNAIVIGNGKVYLVDRPVAKVDIGARRRGNKPEVDIEHPNGVLLCLDAGSGKILWRQNEDIYGTTLALGTDYDTLVMSYQYSQRIYQLPSEKGDRLTGFNATDGKRLWDTNKKYLSRPIINGRTVYTQPYAYDLLTGKQKEGFALDDRKSGGCAPIAGTKNLLLYRSGTLGYTDLLDNHGTENYGGLRPGCWVNTIAVGGLVLMPDATDRCTCDYLNKASIALQGGGLREPIAEPDGKTFKNAVAVKLSAAINVEIRYTLDGSAVTQSSKLYNGPIELTESTTIKARAFSEGKLPSRVMVANYKIE